MNALCQLKDKLIFPFFIKLYVKVVCIGMLDLEDEDVKNVKRM